jgi:hypothetical protein
VGDEVVIHGGFEDGITGTICAVDLSGEVKNWPRFTIQASERVGGKIGGIWAISLEHLRADWSEDTGFWEDGARSWVAEIEAQDWGPTKAGVTIMCTARIRDESTSTKVDGENFSWRVLRADDTLVDRGISTTLQWAQLHAHKAVIWHGVKTNARGTITNERSD